MRPPLTPSELLDWLRAHDPGYIALRRAGRAAIQMPLMFAFADKVIENPTISFFAALGSFAMVLLVDFTGPMFDRIRAQLLLGLTCLALICLGSLAGQTTATAAIGMAIVAFVVLLAGVVSSALAGATTAMLLSFILPVTLPGPLSQIPDRLIGWGMAAAVSVAAISLLWPAPARNPVRALAISACRELATRLRADVEFILSDHGEAAHQTYRAAIARADDAVQRLYTMFFATPYRPTGLTTEARAIVRLVDELRWLNTIVLRSAPPRTPGHSNRLVCPLKKRAADVLGDAADLLERPATSSTALEHAVSRMREGLAVLERATTAELPAAGEPAADVVSGLDPSFQAQELSFVVGQIATNTLFAAAATRRTWLQRLEGRQPEGFGGAFSSFRERVGAHLNLSSSWLRNSLRGGAALGLAVLVAHLTNLQHGFWVGLGALAVLRSNALSTGQNVVRAIVGTTAGLLVGGVLVYLIGTDTTVLWILLPFAILFAGLAPATISFAAGQAAFTMVLLILFNILAPAGWQIGLVRIEDVAVACAVSFVVGALFWPRGAAAELGRALSRAYTDSARYLAGAVVYGVGRCDAASPESGPPREQALQAAAAARRLDDTFRGYLGERGAKKVPMAEVTSLVTGVAGVRLAADAVLELWEGDGARGGDRAAAREALLSAADRVSGWYDAFGASLAGAAAVPDPLEVDQAAERRLVDAVSGDLGGPDGHTVIGVKVIWTGDHLDAARRLQEMLVEPARAAALG